METASQKQRVNRIQEALPLIKDDLIAAREHWLNGSPEDREVNMLGVNRLLDQMLENRSQLNMPDQDLEYDQA